MYANQLPGYITTFDKYTSSNSSVNLINHTTSFNIATQTQTKAFIETSLQYNRFVLVLLQARVYSRSLVDNSNLYLDASSNPDYSVSAVTSSYIVDQVSNTSGSNNNTKVGGHYVLAIGLRKNTLASGGDIIEYIDPLANTRASGLSNRKYCNYDRFVASMHKNSINNPGKANAISVY